MARHVDRTSAVPLSTAPIYVGIDIGKQRHVAAFISTPLLESHVRFEACPTFAFEQGREGFQALLDRIETYAPREHVWIIMEQTGHYHRPLLQYLLEQDLPVYLMHVQRRPFGPLKTDRRDALNQANHLYNQLERHIQVANTMQVARRAVPPSAAASQLHGLMRHRYELISESTRRKNKLTAICDELFPEFTRVFKNPNLPWALVVREAYPTPQSLLDVPEHQMAGLVTRSGGRVIPGVYVDQLRTYAQGTIGTHDPVRVEALVFEQRQLIRELWVLQDHLEQLDDRIAQIVAYSREGQILTSIPPIGPIHAATFLAIIGSIANFESAAALKSYLGWAPTLAQSGSSLDRTSLKIGRAHV
jgi:transposase